MLYLVATPIGNLEDITLRAVETLKSVDCVASEDTRKTGLLLLHLGIKKPQVSFHEHNEDRAGAKLLAMLEEGKSIALVTNAGTPGISDPGYTLVRSAIDAGITVTMIPGASALVMALVLSGLPVHSFTFRGFPPHKGGPRRRFLESDHESRYTLVYYESPYRLKGFLEDALVIFGDRRAVVANDLTKLFERIDRGNLTDLIKIFEATEPRGEYTVVIAGASA